MTTGCAAVVFLTIPQTLIDFFLDLDDPTTAPVLQLAVILLLVAGVFHIADGVQVVLSHLLRGLNDTRTPMIISGFGYWGIGAGLGYLMTFTFGLGAPGIWYGLSLGLITVAILMLHRFHRRERSGLLSRALDSLGQTSS
jgi:MATE family multidrug resistance protein